MDSLYHLSLLREVGVDWYIPRMPLAVIQNPLPNVTISPAIKTEVKKGLVSAISRDIDTGPLIKAKPNIDFGLDIVKKSQKKELVIAPKVSPRIVIEKANSFNLLVAASASLVFVTDVKTNPLTAVWERSVCQFFDEIKTACRLNSNTVQSLDYFSWPIAGSANVNLGEDQLIQLLAGFMRQHILGDKKGVILFGDNAKQYGTSVVSDIDNLQVIAAPSLGAIFTSVAAKAALWRDLQVLNA
jgi:hypothetical protein